MIPFEHKLCGFLVSCVDTVNDLGIILDTNFVFLIMWTFKNSQVFSSLLLL
jgi:hypothetical protein